MNELNKDKNELIKMSKIKLYIIYLNIIQTFRISYFSSEMAIADAS